MYPEASTKTDEGECDIAKQDEFTVVDLMPFVQCGENQPQHLLIFPFMWGFMVMRGVKWGKSFGSRCSRASCKEVWRWFKALKPSLLRRWFDASERCDGWTASAAVGNIYSKNRRQRTYGIACKISQPAGTGHGDGPWSGAMCLSVAPIGISPDRIADPAHIHGKQGCT